MSDEERQEQVAHLVQQLKIPEAEAERLLDNQQSTRGESA